VAGSSLSPVAAHRVLLIEDDHHARTQLRWALGDEFGVLEAADPGTGLSLAGRERPSVVVLDLGLPPRPTDPEEGLRLLREMRKRSRRSKVVVCTGYGEHRHAVDAIHQGAFDFLVKPLDVELLRMTIRRACRLTELEEDGAIVVADPNGQAMIGTCEVMQEVFATVRKVAPTDVPVLITGESGSGKELTARAIHAGSTRRSGPFVPINCGAIPETLLEAELFGHEKGAFTGAVRQKKGRLESAQGGTLFLDEIGELSVALQVKLLRFLQDQTIERVGGLQPIKVNIRVVAATNKDLRQALARGAFREDLYYRLGVVHIQMPPLRSRGNDVVLLARLFLSEANERMGKHMVGLTSEAVRALRAYPWPGNVRELSNRIQRAVVMADGSYITAEDLGIAGNPPEPARGSLRNARDELELALVQQALGLHGNNLSRAARELGISRPTLYGLLRKHGIATGTLGSAAARRPAGPEEPRRDWPRGRRGGAVKES
jgi:two-component system NtrC family response regulator